MMSFKLLSRLLKQVEGLANSKINVVMFKDDPWLWLQYYIGIYFEKPTILIVHKDDKAMLMGRLAHPLILDIITIDSYETEQSDAVGKRIEEVVNKWKATQK